MNTETCHYLIHTPYSKISFLVPVKAFGASFPGLVLLFLIEIKIIRMSVNPRPACLVTQGSTGDLRAAEPVSVCVTSLSWLRRLRKRVECQSSEWGGAGVRLKLYFFNSCFESH